MVNHGCSYSSNYDCEGSNGEVNGEWLENSYFCFLVNVKLFFAKIKLDTVLMKKQFTTWRFMALRVFQEDPYECKKCNEIMELCFYYRPGEVFF